jgi:hypothetical protein
MIYDKENLNNPLNIPVNKGNFTFLFIMTNMSDIIQVI